MTEIVTFILVAESTASIEQMRRRLDSFTVMEKEVFSLITIAGENGELISPDSVSRFDELVVKAGGDYIQVIFCNQIFDLETFKSELSLLRSNTRASCLVRCDQSLKLDCAQEIGGSVFVFQCFHQLVIPVASLAQILVRRSGFALNVNLNFETLSALDWLFQLARVGTVVVVQKKSVTSISLSENVRHYVALTNKNSSFLRSVGYTYEIIMEKIAERLLLEGNYGTSQSATQKLEKIISAERKHRFSKSSPADNDYVDDLHTAGLAVIASGGATLRKRKRGSEIAVREKELQMLLNSLPWRLTSWLRSCKKIVRSNKISLAANNSSGSFAEIGSLGANIVERVRKTAHFDANDENYHIEYQKYLDSEIESILQSRSWRLAGLLKLHKNEMKSKQDLLK